MNKKGFAPIIFILGILIAFGLIVGGSFYIKNIKNSQTPKPADVPQPKKIITSDTQKPTIMNPPFCNSKIGACFNLPKDWLVEETQLGQGGGIPALRINCPGNKPDYKNTFDLFSIEYGGKVDNPEGKLDKLPECGGGGVCMPGFYIKLESKKIGNNNYKILYKKYYSDDQFSREFHTYIQNVEWIISSHPDGRDGKFINCNKDQAEKVLTEILGTLTPDETAGWQEVFDPYDTIYFRVPLGWMEKPEILKNGRYTKELLDPQNKLALTILSDLNLNPKTGKAYASIDEYVGMPYKVATVMVDKLEGRKPLPRAGSENVILVDLFSPDSEKIFTFMLKVGDTPLNTPEAEVEKGQKLFDKILSTVMIGR